MESGVMTQSELEHYLDEMSKPGHWGDGILLSAAVNWYGRPVVIHTVQGEQLIDAANPDVKAKPLHLGLINGNHYLSIHTAQSPQELVNTHQLETNHTDLNDYESILSNSDKCQDYDDSVEPSECSKETKCAEPSRNSDVKAGKLDLTMPYHPDASVIPMQHLRNRKFYFQQHWFTKYPWLHYDATKKGVICCTCANASARGLLRSVKCIEPVFLETGYTNWKKATGRDGRFDSHQTSNCHVVASQALRHLQQSQPVATLLSQQLSAEQSAAQKCLRVLFTTAGFLARQGLAFRGHRDEEGNFLQMLKLRSVDVPEMESWLMRKNPYTHHSIQEEIMQLYGNAVVRRILAHVRRSKIFAVIVDGTQDINRTEQESICIRYVNEDLQPCEEFLGFYAVDGTSGSTLATCIKDCLIRFQLPMENLRGQTYDGASNMSGKYNGCQAIIGREQPLAAYVHCSAHCTNLVASAVCSSSRMVRDSMQLVNDFGVLCNASGNFKTLFGKIAATCENSDDGEPVARAGPVRNIKPLCPTRWLVRVPAIKATLDQYGLILKTLEEARTACSSDVSVRAAGLSRRFQDPETLMCLTMAQQVIEPLESLNRALQSATATIAEMQESAKTVTSYLQAMREDSEFDKILAGVESQIESLNLEHLSPPGARKPPSRFSGSAEAFQTTSVRQYYRIEYLKLIDVAVLQLNERLINCPGLRRYCQLEQMLLTGNLDNNVTQLYPELAVDIRSFQTQLYMFRSLPGMTTTERSEALPTLKKCCEVLTNMVPAMRDMFSHVESLVRLLLVNPASSATAERSFSSLRRLKTYLRATCGQMRLNNLAICHVHKDVMDEIDVRELMREFIISRDNRAEVFGLVENVK